MLLVVNGYIKTIVNGDIENGCVLIDDDGKIAAVGKDVAAPEGAEIIDACGRLVTPGIVEAHSHIGLRGTALRWEATETNENVDPITPQLRVIDGINPIDEQFENAVKYGVTSACVAPGSANVIGGTAAAIKLTGRSVDDMIIKYPVAMKCAFGENPKGTYGQKGKTPVSRMAVASLLRNMLFRAQKYLQDKDAGKDPAFDIKLEALLPVMRREIPLKVHAHRADDILTAIRIAKEFDLDLTLDHCTEGSLISDILAKEGFPAIIGPSFGAKSKPELVNKGFHTAGDLCRAGVKVCITTDAPVIPIHHLPLCAGLAAAEGLDMEEAWRAITVNPADVLGISDRVGALEAGRDGDLVIWNKDPLTAVGATAAITVIDGKIVYKS